MFQAQPSLAFGSRLGLSTKVGGCGAIEVLGEDWLQGVMEDDLGTRGLRKGEPEDEDEFEGVVECYGWVSRACGMGMEIAYGTNIRR